MSSAPNQAPGASQAVGPFCFHQNKSSWKKKFMDQHFEAPSRAHGALIAVDTDYRTSATFQNFL